MPSTFASEKYAIGLCDRCGWQFKLKQLKWLTIKHKKVNLRVCPECWEPDNVRLFIGEVPVNDPQALQDPRTDIGDWAGLFSWNPVATQQITTTLNNVTVTIT